MELNLKCVFKMDTAPKLVEEANALRYVAERVELSDEFRSCFPQIYASHDYPPPYAYLMEQLEGFVGTEELLFERPADTDGDTARRLVDKLLDLLLSAYNDSLRPRFRPNIWVDYVERIKDRLVVAANRDSRFASHTVTVVPHGHEYRPWQNYLEALRRDRAKIDSLAPPFTTFVHGDPNPENVLAAIDPKGVMLRFIDVKEWRDGDYLFDIAKFVHYLVVTGPVERMKLADGTVKAEKRGDTVEIDYTLSNPDWIEKLSAQITHRVKEFANDHGDSECEQRLALGMASNLLGLPANRLTSGREDSAVILYAEGLRYLDEFCAKAGIVVD